MMNTVVPTYTVAQGDELIFYSTVAGVLSGSVAGDHMSPISDTTVISAMSCRCKLLNHVLTQAPYSVTVVILCILFGTIPVGRDAMPNFVCILLGAAATVGIVLVVGVPVTSNTGRYDFFTELFLKVYKNENYEELRQETIEFNDTNSGILGCCGKVPNEEHPDMDGDVAPEDVKEKSDEKMDEVTGEEQPTPVLQTGMSSSLLGPGEAHA